MPISMWIRNEVPEPGARLDEGSLPWLVPREVLNLSDTPLLVAVDPYGNTVFNRFQVREQLPREVAYLRRELDSATDEQMLDELERLMTVVAGRVHRYLWFLGD